MQRVLPPWRFHFEQESGAGLSREDLDALIHAYIDAPLDVANGRMLRALLIDIGEEERILVIVSHHLVIDGWSASLILEEITELYEQFHSGRIKDEESNIGRFTDYVAHMESWADSEECSRQIEQWREEIQPELAASVIPADRSRHAGRIATFGEVEMTITGDLVADLAECGRQWRTGAVQIIDAVISCLIARASGDDAVTTGLALTNRPQAEYERVIANFANESIIHVQVGLDQPFTGVLDQMKSAVRNAVLRLDTPFEMLAESLQLKRIGRRRLAMPIFFSLYDLMREGTLRLDGIQVTRIPDSHVNPFQEIGIRAVSEPDALRFKIEYDETIFDEDRIRRFLDTLVAMLGKVLEDPEARILELPFDERLAQGVEEGRVNETAADQEHVEPVTLLETRLAELWTELLGVHPVGLHDDFFELGGSSLLAIRLIDRVHEVFGAQLGIDALMSGTTLKEVASRIEKSGKRLQIDRAVWISRDHEPTRLFCLPGIGGLAAFTYRDIAGHLEGDVALVGLQMRGLDGLDEPDDTVESMARTMLEGIRSIQETGPYHVCGYSFGGSISIELARQLHAAGETVASLLLLDTYPPNFIRMHRRLLRGVKNRIKGAGRSTSAERDEFDPIMPEDDPAIAALARIGGLGNSIENTIAMTRSAFHGYKPQPYEGDVHLVLSTTNADEGALEDSRFIQEWRKQINGILTTHPVAVPHLELVRSGSELVADVIRSITRPEEGAA